MNIYAALSAVMNDVQGVGKKERNSAPGANFNFRGIDAVTNAVGPALRKHGVIVVPEVLDQQYGTITVGKDRKEMGHARLLIAFTWYGPDGDSIRSVTAGEAFDSGDKATAKAHSVAFRTAMIQTLCLPTDEPDPDTHVYERAAAPTPDPLLQAKTLLWEKAQARGWDKAQLADEYATWSTGSLLGDADAEQILAFAGSLTNTVGRRKP